MRNKKIPVFILVLISAGIALYLTKDTLTPYVPFDKAIETGSSVQIIGKLVKPESITYDDGNMLFVINDDKARTIRISYKGIKPANFEEAEQIVVIGKYSKEKKIFESDKILTKCPSKYEKKDLKEK
jgi:cytochrome c-type biogenesis protein CcmE